MEKKQPSTESTYLILWHWFWSDSSSRGKTGNIFLIKPDSLTPSKVLPWPQWRGFPPLRRQAVVVPWVQIFHCLPSSSQGLVCTRWHCNNTCYTAPFIYKINPTTPKPGELSWSAAVSVSILRLPLDTPGLLAGEGCCTRGSAVSEPGGAWEPRATLSTGTPLGACSDQLPGCTLNPHCIIQGSFKAV